VASQASILTQGTCKAEELCAPCWHPATGNDTGACKLSCDPGPKQGAPKCPHSGPDVFSPAKFPACATGAHCMPSALLDASMSAELCGPSENLAEPSHPQGCSAFALAYFGNYQGVCLSTCLQFSGLEGSIIKQGSCDSLHQGVLCYKPFGAPTGAPGCN